MIVRSLLRARINTRAFSYSQPFALEEKPKDGQTTKANDGQVPKKLTMAEKDAELMRKLEERSGEGGSAAGTVFVTVERKH